MKYLSRFFTPQISLMRSIDPAYPTHQKMLTLCFLASFLAVSYWIIFLHIKVPVALIAAGYLSGSLLLSWALSREILPAYEDVSIMLIPVFTLFVWWFGFPSLSLIGFILLMHRAITGICGKHLTIIDIILLLILFIWSLQSMKVIFTVEIHEIIAVILFFVSFLLHSVTVSPTIVTDIGKAQPLRKRVLTATLTGGVLLSALTVLTDSAHVELYLYTLVCLSSVAILHAKRRFQS